MNLTTICVLALCMVCGCFAATKKSTLTGTEEANGGYKITCGLPDKLAVDGASYKKGADAVELVKVVAGFSKPDGTKSILFTKEGRTTHKGDYTCTAVAKDAVATTGTISDVLAVGPPSSSAGKVMTSAIIIPLCMLVTSLM